MTDFDITKAEFSPKLRKLEVTDKAHADIFNSQFQRLIRNDVKLNENINNIKIPVTSVNNKTGDIELKATDIKDNEGKTVQENLVEFKDLVDKGNLNSFETNEKVTKLEKQKDGFYENINIKGQTLVSICDPCENVIFDKSKDANLRMKTICSNTIGILPKENTEYTFRVNIASMTAQYLKIMIEYNGNSPDYYPIASVNGINKTIIKFKNSPITSVKIYVDGDQFEAGKICSIYNITMVEDDWINKELPYINGIKSVGTIEKKISIRSTGKNLANISENNVRSKGNDVSYSIDNNVISVSTSNIYAKYENIALNLILKPNTQYRLLAKKLNRINDTNCAIAIKSASYSCNYTGDRTEENVNFTFTTKNESFYIINIFTTLITPQANTVMYKDIMVVEDEEDPTFDEYKEDILKITPIFTGKNLFDIDTYSESWSNILKLQKINDGLRLTSSKDDAYMTTEMDTSNKINKYYIPAKPNTDYSISYNTNLVNGTTSHDLWCGFKDKDGKHISYTGLVLGRASGSFNCTFKTPSNSSYVVLRFDNNIANTILDITNIQLKEGIKSPYEPYSIKDLEPITELRSLPNGTFDEIIGDKLIRRVEKVVFDGTENWIDDNIDGAYFQMELLFPNGCKSGEGSIISDRFSFGLNYGENDKEGISSNGTKVYLKILKSKLSTANLGTFKKWLSENNVTVYYKLENPIIININPLILRSYKNGYLISDNSIVPAISGSYATDLVSSNRSSNMAIQSLKGNLNDSVKGMENTYNKEIIKLDEKIDNELIKYAIKEHTHTEFKYFEDRITDVNKDLKYKLNELTVGCSGLASKNHTHTEFNALQKKIDSTPNHFCYEGWLNLGTYGNGDNTYCKVQLPSEFKGKKFTILTAVQGWSYNNDGIMHTLTTGSAYFDYNDATFSIFCKANTTKGFINNVNICYLAIV